MTIIDRNGTVLVRSPGAEDWIGKNIKESNIGARIFGQKNGLATLTGIDGVQRIYAFSALGEPEDPGAFVAVGVPIEEIFAKTNRDFIIKLIILFFIIIIRVFIDFLPSRPIVIYTNYEFMPLHRCVEILRAFAQ